MSWREKYKEHLRADGGLKQSAPLDIKAEIFIARAREIHGDKYDYSKSVYTRAHDQVAIICPIHGEFSQKAHNHLVGNGCPRCSGKNKRTEEFISQAHEVHGGKFDYSRTVYVRSADKVVIICPIHGEFSQKANNHLQGQGCPKCYGREKTTKDYVAEASILHNGRYDYTKTKYTIAKDKIEVICPAHGSFFPTADNHLRGSGCPCCAVSNQNTIYLVEYLCAGTRLGTKVGITNNFDQRLSKLRSASPYDVEPIQSWVVDNPREIETKVLKQFTRAGSLGAYFEGSTEILEEPTEQIAQFIEELVYASV